MPQLAPHIFDLLHQQGVHHAFGIPGDFALTLYDALAESKIEPVITTHEPCAGFAADAYSRIRGLGLAVVTYGVGGLNMVNPVAGAYAEKSPLVVLSGAPGVEERQTRDLLHHKVKSFDSQRRVFEEVTGYAVTLDNPATADMEIHRAIDYAMTFKRPVYLEVPRDQVYAEIVEADYPPLSAKQTDADTLMEAIAEALTLLNQAQSTIMIVGVEVHRFGMQSIIVHLAERLGIPVCSTMLGKSAFPEGHPQYIGVYNGAIGSDQVTQAVEASDCVIMVGTFMTDFNLGLFSAHLDPARTISITSEQIAIKHHQYNPVRFVDFLTRLNQSRDLPHRDPSSIMAKVCRVTPSLGALTMGGLIYELNQFIDDAMMVVTDAGDVTFTADDIWMKAGTTFLSPAFYASMGFGVPGMLGAQLADPSRRAIALVGDGAFQMTGMELLTAQRLGLNPIVIVVNNGAFASLRMMGHKNADFVHISRLDYAQLAQVMGGRGFVVKNGPQLHRALAEARDCNTFCLLDVHVASDDVSPASQRVASLFSQTLKG